MVERFFQGGSQCILRPEICPSHTSAVFPWRRHPTGITCRWILFIRSVHDVFSIARAQVGTRTKRDVETCLAGSHDVERDLGTHRTNVLASRCPLELSRVAGNFFVDPGIIEIIANQVAIS